MIKKKILFVFQADHHVSMTLNALEIQTYRIQAWDFSSIPEIDDCKYSIHFLFTVR